MKRMVALFLVLLLSIESFAAVVSDNDGSAFITKAEFDSLKSDFQSQIDRYNTSIDNKIDGAIAGYLAGINMTKKEDLDVLINNYNDMMWVNDLYCYHKKRTWAANEDTSYTESTIGWGPLTWMKNRLIRYNGIDLNGAWLSGGNSRYIFWELKLIPTPNQYFGKSDFLSNRTRNLAVPVLLIDLPLVNGYNVLKSGDEKVCLEGLGEVYGTLNPIYEDGFVHERGDGNGEQLVYDAPEDFGVSRNCNVSISSDDDYWLKLQANLARWEQLYNEIGTSPDLSYELKDWADIPEGYQWYFASNFDAKSGTFAQPAANFVSEPKDTRNYGINTILDWIRDGGSNTQIVNNRNNAFESKWNVSTADDWRNYEILLNDFMLGRDSTQICNVGKQKTTDERSGSPYRYSWEDSEWENLLCTYTFRVKSLISKRLINMLNKNNSEDEKVSDFRYTSDPDNPSTIKWPLWPQMAIKDLMHSQYLLNNKPLKAGQGLPIALNITKAGNIKLKFKYEVFDIGSSDDPTPAVPSQKVKVFIKKNDFTTNNVDDYYDNIETSTTAAGSLNGFDLETNNEITFDIEVKKDENMWFRLAPFDTTPNGRYAKISNLSIQLETE